MTLWRHRLAAILAILTLSMIGAGAGHGHLQQTAASAPGFYNAASSDLTPAKSNCPVCKFSQQTAPDLRPLKLAPPHAVSGAMRLASDRLPVSLARARQAARAPPIALDIVA